MMSTRTRPALLLALVTAGLPAFANAQAQDIPARPEEITFAPLDFQPPDPGTYRHELSNGVPVYLAPSTELPLVNIVFTFKGGSYLDQPAQVGVAEATGDVMRRGGTTTVSAEQLDEQFDFLAADVNVRVGPTSSTASLNCLKSNLDESFNLFIDMIRNPGFQTDRFELFIDEQLEAMRQRNDFPDAILGREWAALLYGRDHFEARLATRPMLQSFTALDLREMHKRIFQPGNLIIAVTGDFEPRAMQQRLERALSGWEVQPRVEDPPAPDVVLTPGVYHVEKDIPQGKVDIGCRAITRDDPDYFAFLIANDILGGGGFTSRITDRVRNDEGLAYAAGSRFRPRVYYPGEFRAAFQSKNRTVALAIKIILEEIQRLRDQPVSDAELATAKNAFIQTFPRTFESKAGMLAVFVDDELTGRPADYWRTYRDRIRAVTADDVQRVAQARLDPESMAIVIVGKWDEIAPGDLEGRASMNDFFNGAVTHMPLRDPFTLEPLPEP